MVAKRARGPLSRIDAPERAVLATEVAAAAPNGAPPIGLRALSGEVLIVRGLLDAIGMTETMTNASLGAIEDVLGPEAADAVRVAGFERLHEVVSIDDIVALTAAGYERHQRIAPELARRSMVGVLGHHRHFYLESRPNVRFTVPYTSAAQNKQLDEFAWNGKVTAHGPHHDSWYCCPTNCINVWIAVSDVVVGNGLTIYPTLHGKRLPCDDRGRVLRDQYFQGGLNFELRTGDAIVFHGDHLHASELNWTDTTRHVVSLRLTLDKPEFIGDSGFRFEYIRVEVDDSPGARWVERNADRARRAARRLDALWRTSRWNSHRGHGYLIATDDRSVFDDVSSDFPEALSPSSALGLDRGADLSVLALGTIRAISDQRCVARLYDGDIVTFSRRCPHQGADLAGGYLRGNEIVCPWHNLPFDLRSGRSRCDAIRGLVVGDGDIGS